MAVGSTLNSDLDVWTMQKERIKSQLSSLSGVFLTSKTVLVSQGLGTNLALTVSCFQSEPSDTTGYAWRDKEGNPRTYDMPPYYISDMQQALVSMREYERHSCTLSITSLLKDSNPLIAKTFKAACRYIINSKVSK